MGLDLYTPDYEQTVRGRAQRGVSTEQLVNDMGELVVLDARRRDTFPVRTNCKSVIPSLVLKLLKPSQCNQAFQRDLYRLQGTRLPRPRLRCPFHSRKARDSTPRPLVEL